MTRRIHKIKFGIKHLASKYLGGRLQSYYENAEKKGGRWMFNDYCTLKDAIDAYFHSELSEKEVFKITAGNNTKK